MPEQKHFSDRIKISVSFKEGGSDPTNPPEIEVAQTCFHITRSLFLVIAAGNGYGDGFMQDRRVENAEAFFEVAILGVIFTDLAFNSLDEYGLRIHRENNGGENNK